MNKIEEMVADLFIGEAERIKTEPGDKVIFTLKVDEQKQNITKQITVVNSKNQAVSQTQFKAFSVFLGAALESKVNKILPYLKQFFPKIK